MIPDYTLVVGVDKKHLEQLQITWPTWRKNKPGLLSNPMLIFYDQSQLTGGQVKRAIDHPDMLGVPWPPEGVVFEGNPNDKWTDPQRVKMLSGFVQVAASLVETDYWLKIDTDVVATGDPDWIDPDWFQDSPAIVSHAWSFTKPPHQMVDLDMWVENNKDKLAELSVHEHLALLPEPGSDRLGHKRIISWCSFWEMGFTQDCHRWAHQTCGAFKMPVPSQDGYLWYCAKRLGRTIIRTQMKKRGWAQWLTMKNIRKSAEEAMGE